MAWTDLSFPFGSLLSSTKMTQLDANLDALAAGDTGAPALKTNTVLYNVSSTDASTVNVSGWTTLHSVNITIPSAANTMVIMNRHQRATSAISASTQARLVSSGSWVVSTATSLGYINIPYTAYDTGYMDVSSIRGVDQIFLIQLNGVSDQKFYSSTIYFV